MAFVSLTADQAFERRLDSGGLFAVSIAVGYAVAYVLLEVI